MRGIFLCYKMAIPPRNKSNQGERCENACIFIAEPKGFVLVQIRGDKKARKTALFIIAFEFRGQVRRPNF